MADETGKDDRAKQGMIDDISSELRDWAFIVDETIGKAHVVMLSGSVFSKAADEIDRLRSLIDGVNNIHHKIKVRVDGEIDEMCNACEDLWPCVTHVFLHPEED